MTTRKAATGEKVAVLIAAGSGMGADAARRLAADGYSVGILSSSGKGEALGKELAGFGMTGSNLEPDDLNSVCMGALDRWGRIDVLVNSAGHGAKGPILEMSDADWHEAMDVYLLNVIRAARIVTPIMAQNGGGAIINISSFATFEPDPDFPSSGVMRAALANFTKIFSDQFAAKNVRMNNPDPRTCTFCKVWPPLNRPRNGSASWHCLRC